MLDDGKIRHLGIDYIGSDEDFLDTLLSDRRFDFFRLPYNAIDDLRMNGAQSSAIFAAQDAGKLVFATNPTKDGMLRALNGDATDVLYSAFPDRVRSSCSCLSKRLLASATVPTLNVGIDVDSIKESRLRFERASPSIRSPSPSA